MSANLKVIFIVVIGVGACSLSVLLSQHFQALDRNNLLVRANIEQAAGGVEQIRLLGRDFIQRGDEVSWARITDALAAVRANLHAAPYTTDRWHDEVALLSRSLDDYHAILLKMQAPAVTLNTKKSELQRIGLTFLREVESGIIAPFRRDDGVRLYNGQPLDPFKSRAKDAAFDLVTLHTRQQVILLELMLDLDLDSYKREKENLSAALAQHEQHLRYISVLMADQPELQTVLDSLDRKLTHLLAQERDIIECCGTLAELDVQLAASGNTLLDTGRELSSVIASDTQRAGYLNQLLTRSLLLGIIGGLGILGTLLARNIIQFVNALRRTQQDLQRSDSILKATLESTTDGVLVVTGAGTVSHCNTPFRDIWSIPPDLLITRDDHALVEHASTRVEDPARFVTRIREIFQTSASSEDTLRLADGRVLERRSYPLATGGPERGRVWMFRDVTDRQRAEEEREKLEAQLRQAQKMEAVGQLAGGVAHDFNNILTAIFGNVELAIAELEATHPGARSVLDGMHQIERSAKRASSLTRQLLAFSRRQIMRPEVLDLNTTLHELEKMLRRLITEDIKLELVLAAEPPAVRADPGQLEQVVVNLVVNARDAMSEGGRLTVETANVVLDDSYVAVHPEAQPGEHVLLAVSDTGHGMDAATIERVFEPFFTTKPVGKGTGLGLSTVYGIVKQAGGHVGVYSEIGRGTTFRVYLPVVREPATVATAARVELPIPTGTETIIMCEDDSAVRELTANVLEDAGYHVLAATSATQAIQMAADHVGPIHLLITDVIMPEMNGRKLSDTLAGLRPGLVTLFVSGYTSNVIVHHGVLEENVEFLEKPYSRRQLLQRVRAILDEHYGPPL